MPPTDPDEDSLFSDANAIEPLLAAFEAVCRFLQILGPNDPQAETVALAIIEAARSGERDCERLRDLVLLTLRGA
jgi:hypothetical protein